MKTAVVIGRFQPFHFGHQHMIEEACKIADQVIIVIGDTGCARTAKDPWTFEERVEMIQKSMPSLGWKADITSVEDSPYDDNEWASSVRQAVSRLTQPDDEIVLVGHSKDESSFYLEMFPDWALVEIPAFAHPALIAADFKNHRIDATFIREAMFTPGGATSLASKLMPIQVSSVIRSMSSERSERIGDEISAIAQHKIDSESEISRRYGTQASIAADCLLRDKDHVLLIRRKGRVGKGTLALPGGFVDAGETLRRAAERELLEETGIDLNSAKAKDAVQSLPVILGDSPGRSQRGRIVTLVHPYFVPKASEFLKPIAGDDAEWAGWVSYKDIEKLKSEFFSDHYHLIKMENDTED